MKINQQFKIGQLVEFSSPHQSWASMNEAFNNFGIVIEDENEDKEIIIWKTVKIFWLCDFSTTRCNISNLIKI